MSDLPQKNTNIDRNSKFTNPVAKPGPYEARVINNLDPEYQGALTVQLLKTNTSGNVAFAEGQVYIARYLSPFAGQTPSFGSTKNDTYKDGQQSYGMWFVPPDVGTKVLVIFAEGNPNLCYWLGCVNDKFMNHSVPDHAASTFTTDGTPDDLKGKKLPVTEYNKQIETGTGIDPTKFKKPYQKLITEMLQSQGLLEDETRGITSSSARREVPSAVFGLSTPGPIDKTSGSPKVRVGTNENFNNIFKARLGGTSLVFDDGNDKFLRKKSPSEESPDYANVNLGETDGDVTRPHNELVRLRTRTGHQILLHNTEDLIYIGNSRGTAWIELTSDGKIDIFAEDSISMHTKNDFNFTADRNITIEAGANLSIKASGNYVGDKINKGRVQIESSKNTNILVGGSTKITTTSDFDVNTGGANKLTAGSTTDILSGGNHTETASEIHMNGPQAATAAVASALSTHRVPGHTTLGILSQRSPQAEPWNHHENLNPLAFKIAVTDRDLVTTVTNPLPTPTTPDVFKKEFSA
tara:strand:- start:30773 stop:32338 length:1566 start_codon:yes stop_codon:yes gene_type:complete